MSTSKAIDRICAAAVVIALLITVLFMNGEAIGVQAASRVMGYENRLFDTGRVHTIDIVMDDWDSFIDTCVNEEYAACSVVIDGEAYKNVGIRAKGNTSLSSVASMNSDRYSFKVEFDQYESGKSYYGLDKLSLNNIIQDNTYMKDYLTYRLMGEMGAAAPLCSYVYITVNGEDWGLYLAVEGIEDAFLQRNYGTDHGELYKPDNLGMGGGRGNGKDFNMEDFMAQEEADSESTGNSTVPQMPDGMQMPGGFDPSQMGGGMQRPGGFDPSQMENFDFSQMLPEGMELPEDFDASSFEEIREQMKNGEFDFGDMGGFGGRGGGGMGSSETKLQYIDDDPDSYSTIFDSAKTDITDADKERLIASLKALSEGNAEDSVAIDAVIRYFVVHNFVCNGDSYTGNMIHNYYLYEEDGLLQMLPWDYNLAFGSFQGGSGGTNTVNEPIDTPVSGGTGEDRPMIGFIFENEEYTELYHQYFAQFLEQTDFAALIDETAALIAPYVEKDPTKFCTYEEFERGVSAIREFCLLREQSILGQLDGTIPSTTQGQNADPSALIDASHISISDMGSMGMGGGMGGRGDRENWNEQFSGDASAETPAETPAAGESTEQQPSQSMPAQGEMQMPGGFDPSQMMGGEMPGGFDPSQMMGGEMPGGFDPSQMMGGEMPGGFDPSQMGGEMPGGFDPSQMGGGQMPGGFGGMGGSMQPPGGMGQAAGETVSASSSQASSEASAPMEKPSSGRGDREQMAGNMPFPGSTGTAAPSSANAAPMLILSAVVLGAGLAFALLFKRHR